MTEKLPKTRMTVHARVDGSGAPLEHGIYEGEVPMTQTQADQYKQLLGDEKARITVGRDISEKDYGSGGGGIVNDTLV